jgi:hypothetical protein
MELEVRRAVTTGDLASGRERTRRSPEVEVMFWFVGGSFMGILT